jgi:hypothetical protein
MIFTHSVTVQPLEVIDCSGAVTEPGEQHAKRLAASEAWFADQVAAEDRGMAGRGRQNCQLELRGVVAGDGLGDVCNHLEERVEFLVGTLVRRKLAEKLTEARWLFLYQSEAFLLDMVEK